MNSSKGKSSRTLASSSPRAEARKLLVSVANLRDDDQGFEWFKKNLPYVLKDVTAPTVCKEAVFTNPDESFSYIGSASTPREKWKYWILPLRATLRAIWRAPDRRTKEWGMFRVSQDFFSQGKGDLIHAPLDGSWDFLLKELKPRTRTERLILEFTRWAELTRYCDNPDCPAPFFIAARRNQKYCTSKCAEPAQREFKREWWAKNGKGRRAAKAKRPK
jgi:hypothetical protein